MFDRDIISEFDKWSAKANRKPLVLRGARQVGKTTAVNIFARQFEQYLYLNLEKDEDIRYFENFKVFDDLVQALFLGKNLVRTGKKTLVFIDEIQESPDAIRMLRYFYEQTPEIHVIAAGSRLAASQNRNLGFPVGRVEYLNIYPVSFPEFLIAIGEEEAFHQLMNIPVNEFAHDKLLKLFHTYALTGGMPEVVEQYALHRDLTILGPVYESLLSSFMDDSERFARNSSQVQLIRHAVRAIFSEAGKRIKFDGFGQSNYRSREMGEALRKLENAFLIRLVHPSTQAIPPAMADKRKSPRLQVLDTGLLNYFNGLQVELLAASDLHKVYQGTIAEHIIGQELLARQSGSLGKLSFWVREKKEAQAEVDYIHPYKGMIIPVEVKSGPTGKLRSLHLFMDLAPHHTAIRFYPGKVSIDQVKTHTNKTFNLLNLPYYLVSRIDQYLDWAR
jgi:predicted AAA+ superfamily ATPase